MHRIQFTDIVGLGRGIIVQVRVTDRIFPDAFFRTPITFDICETWMSPLIVVFSFAAKTASP